MENLYEDLYEDLSEDFGEDFGEDFSEDFSEEKPQVFGSAYYVFVYRMLNALRIYTVFQRIIFSV